MTDLTQWPHSGLPPLANPIVYTEAENNDRKAVEVRTERNSKLAATDWTQLADAPVDKAVWETYRQTLRDITAAESFPWTVTWPETP